jgi:hypothetical protein
MRTYSIANECLGDLTLVEKRGGQQPSTLIDALKKAGLISANVEEQSLRGVG